MQIENKKEKLKNRYWKHEYAIQNVKKIGFYKLIWLLLLIATFRPPVNESKLFLTNSINKIFKSIVDRLCGTIIY